MFIRKKMNTSGGSRRSKNELIFIALAIFLSVKSAAASDHLCRSSKVHNDSIIRIGFLSRYKSSKVSQRESMFLNWLAKFVKQILFDSFVSDIKAPSCNKLYHHVGKSFINQQPFASIAKRASKSSFR